MLAEASSPAPDADVTTADATGALNGTGTTSFNHADIAYDVVGPADGPLLLLLHAGITDRRLWDAQMAALPQRPELAGWRIARIDLRGWGASRSDAVTAPYVDDIEIAIRRLRGDDGPALLVGCSFGARVALDVALEYPARVRGLVLFAPALGGFPFSPALDATEDAIAEALARDDLDAAAEIDVRTWVDGPRRTPQEVAPDVRMRALELARDVYTVALNTPEPQVIGPPIPALGRLAYVRTPTLVVLGEHDQPDIGTIGQILAANIPGARLETLADCGHLPPLEQPERSSDLIATFAAAQPERPSRNGVTLHEIDLDLLDPVVGLTLHPEQVNMVLSPVDSLAEALVCPWMLPLAIRHADELVGMVMFSQSYDPREPIHWIHRLLIDRKHQGRGYGRSAMELVLEYMSALPGCQKIAIGYKLDNTAARTLYLSLGFADEQPAPWGGDEVVSYYAVPHSDPVAG